MAREDLGQVAGIEQEYASPWNPALLAAELAFPGSIALVTVDLEGEIFGWCCARSAGGEAELLKIAVRPDRRGAGIAGALLRHLEQILIDHKVETIFLEVRSQNEPALRFYLKHGFEEVGNRPGYYANPVDDALIFKKELLSKQP